MFTCNSEVSKILFPPTMFFRRENLFFIFDPCHLLKNTRNCLCDLKLLHCFDQTIKWDYTIELHKLQLSYNLVLAKKLRGKHVDYIKNKMNVKFAAQTLSSYVAHAIKIFDICKSKNPVNRGFKAPIQHANFNIKITEIEVAIQLLYKGLL